MADSSVVPRLQRLAGLRDRVVARIREVNTTTEHGTMSAGRRLTRMVGIASDHIGRLREVLAGPVAADDSSLARAIAAQSGHVRGYVESIARAVSTQRDRIADVSSHAREISISAQAIERLNAAARILAMNARIEAGRSGHDSVFRVIALEMQQLSHRITEANVRITELATTLQRSMPELQAHGEELVAQVQQFSDEARGHSDEVDAQVMELRQAVVATVQQSDRALEEVIRESQGAVSELQFQDVCAQSLLHIDTWLHAEQRICAEEAGAGAAELAKIRSPAHSIVGEDSAEVVQASAGDVMMF